MARRPGKRPAKRHVSSRTPSVRRDGRVVPVPSRRHNLPTQLTTFIGREQETAEVKRLLACARLLSLTGAGGAGKTRLALRLAVDVLAQYPDGVWFVDLAPVADPALVPNRVAAALDVAEQPTRRLTDVLAANLRTKTLLLVLDNCEHLRAACQSLADRLLRTTETLRILATSREPLGVEGEVLYGVPPLRLPEVGEARVMAGLAQYDGIRLFAERAALSQRNFAVTATNSQAILQICRRLDGMPLAIEFAAARVKTLSPEQIAVRLDDRFQLLTGGAAYVLPHHQTLEAAFDWSYALLTPSEQMLLRRLAVFVGGWTMEAAEYVCGGGAVGAPRVFETLTRLVDKSMVTVVQRDGTVRFHLLETVREYALARGARSEDPVDVRARHLAWYLRVVEQTEAAQEGPDQDRVWENLETEHDNLRAALRQALAGHDPDAGLRMATPLVIFWMARGHVTEGLEWLERALLTSHSASPRHRVRAMAGAIELAATTGRLDRAAELVNEAIPLARANDDGRSLAFVLGRAAEVARERGELRNARRLLKDSLARYTKARDKWGARMAFSQLGDVARGEGNGDEAVRCYEQALAISREVGDRRRVANLLRNLGITALERGDGPVARKHLIEALRLAWSVGAKHNIARTLAGLGACAAFSGEFRRAARLLAAGETLRATLSVLNPEADQRLYTRYTSIVQAGLGKREFAAAWSAGRSMPLARVVEDALNMAVESARPDNANGQGLTARERQIAALIASGLTNRNIASCLVTSRRTVESHVQNILAKLGFRTRSQIAVWAVERGLGDTGVRENLPPLIGQS